jgi:hypothetical protein
VSHRGQGDVVDEEAAGMPGDAPEAELDPMLPAVPPDGDVVDGPAPELPGRVELLLPELEPGLDELSLLQAVIKVAARTSGRYRANAVTDIRNSFV